MFSRALSKTAFSIPRATSRRFITTFADLAKSRKATTQQCWEAFDALEPVKVDELVGYRWKGYEIYTDHPWCGLLDANNWFGKEYFSSEHGNPLLTYATDEKSGNDVFPAEPLKYFALTAEGTNILGDLRGQIESPEGVGCRLRTILFRGFNTASMFYDQLPINDTFKKVDDNTVFGVMDCKMVPDPPYFFVLEKYLKI